MPIFYVTNLDLKARVSAIKGPRVCSEIGFSERAANWHRDNKAVCHMVERPRLECFSITRAIAVHPISEKVVDTVDFRLDKL